MIPVVLSVVLGLFFADLFVGGAPVRAVCLRFLPGLAIGTLAYCDVAPSFSAHCSPSADHEHRSMHFSSVETIVWQHAGP